MRDTIDMAREAGLRVGPSRDGPDDVWGVGANLERLVALVRADERAAMMQLFTDPENQPTQHGTVTMEYMQREVAAEREACAKFCETHQVWVGKGKRGFSEWGEDEFVTGGIHQGMDYAAAIRARGNT